MWGETGSEESPTFKNWVERGSWLLDHAKEVFENKTRLKVVEFATQQWGKSYSLGGKGPEEWDCSGLASAAYECAGVSIPRTANEQWEQTGRLLSDEEKILPGDLVFFGERTAGHVGIIIWSPYKTFIEANGQVGQVRVSSLDSRSKIYRQDLAKRVLGFKRVV